MGIQQFDESTALLAQYQFTNGDGTTVIALLQNLQSPARCDQLAAVNADSIDHTVTVSITWFSSPVPIGSVLVPAGAGLLGVPPVNLLAPILFAPQAGIVIPIQGQLNVNMDVAVTGSNPVSVVALGGYC